MADDIKLLEENLASPRKWSHIARKLPGRNQHQVKNRFVELVAKDLFMRRSKTLMMLKDEKTMISLCRSTLENLKRAQEQENIYEFSDESSNEEIIGNQSNFFVLLSFL